MALSKRERLSVDFSITKIADNILQFKNKNALIDALSKVNNRDQLIELNKMLLQLKLKYENEMRNRAKNRKFKMVDNILKALYDLKFLPVEFNYLKDIEHVNNVYAAIKNNSIILESDIIKKYNIDLTNSEKNLVAIPLIASHIKGSFYSYLLSKNMTKEYIENECSINRTQLDYYLSFYKMINKYNFLIRINLSFTKIVKNLKKIENIIESDEDLKNICKTSLQERLPLFSMP